MGFSVWATADTAKHLERFFKQPLKRLEKAFKCYEGLCWLWGNHRESLGEGGTDPEELWGTGASPPAASAPPLCPRVSTIRHT